MKLRFTALLAALVLVLGAASVWAQSQTGEIFGKVTDASGAVLPGVTVTLTGPSLLQPQSATTSETGSFQFPRLNVGTYNVKFELAGFKTVIKENIEVTVGFSANVSTALGVSAVQETVTVTGESPIVDTKQTGTKQTFTLEQLQQIPSARDPWVILQQTAGIAMDRENIGGNMSGQQSNYISRGGNTFNNKWSLDGVDITDMNATGASPTYYDFDAFQEMTINTGGVDVTQQTGGVGVNLVTKSGTDRFHGSGRVYNTNDKFESQNITDAQRGLGATSGNPIQNINDFGTEMGGPIKRGKAWAWGSYGKQDVKVGVIGFYQPTSQCQAIKAAPLNYAIKDVNECLNTDRTTIRTTNLKGEVQLFKGNKLSGFNLFSLKERNARNASDTTPPESTVRQAAVPGTYGFRNWWNVGPNPTYKVGDQWVVSDRLLIDAQYAHVGNNFILDYHTDDLVNVQPFLVIAGTINGRSTPDGAHSVNVRPTNQVTLNANYFLPGKLFGDHALKVGGYYKNALSFLYTHTPGNAVARFPTIAASTDANDCADVAAGCQLQLTRDGQSQYYLVNNAAYAQDTITHGRATFQLGVRYDYNHDTVLDASVSSNPFRPDWLPAVSFPGADPGVKFNDWSPRLGFTYDVSGDGKTIAKANYAMYFGQVGTGGVASQLNPVSRVSARYRWVDLDHDKFVDANEIVNSAGAPAAVTDTLITPTGNWSPLNPTAVTTANTVDPNLKNDRTREFIVGLDREVGKGFAAGVSYIWRKYDQFQWTPANGIATDGSSYTETTYTPPAADCPAGARCPTVTYFTPAISVGSVTTLTNQSFWRDFNGVEATARKRMSNHWMMNTSFTYNSTLVHYGKTNAYTDPTNIAFRNGYQYDYLTTGSGLGNVYVNAKWLFKLSGMYQLPYSVNVSAFYNAREGYPFEPFILTPTRSNNGGQASVLLDPVGENRLPNFQNVDFHVERPISFLSTHLVPSLDIFNVGNFNTIQALQRQQNATTANQISSVVAPRVIRFGIRVNW
ncbi:MAG TPA: carboxypeptidase regulatory-like domain-containing protein [Vicinamibacterales bacterium]|nr:carboxypeptidase regulatory-like domain-containing protein [Vicinamibacterales bacterium]